MHKNTFTKYFDNCKAVFQGGGCKAIAYVGAYEEAYNRGVFFSELSGASAGAMIAALIAAGAKLNDLKKVVMKLDFSQFITNYQKPNWATNMAMKIFLKNYGVGKYLNYISIKEVNKSYGIFDMEPLYIFVNGLLKELTGKEMLTFNDLTPDLHIVCSDLYTHKLKTWNRYKTPEESIAKAVCCSCAIPFFFKPYEGRYVDGGVLCNLPNFVFADEPNYNKILSFRFKSTGDDDSFSSMTGYCKALSETIVDGADKMHELFNVETYEISIPLKGIAATDFTKLTNEKKIELMESGKQATKEFFDNEGVYSISANKNRNRSMTTNEQVWSLVSYLGYEVHEEIIVSCDNTYWSWYLFPTIINWVNNKSLITIIVSKNISCHEEDERSRRRMLKAIGCNIIEQEAPVAFYGFFFKGKDHWRGIIYDNLADNSIQAKFYNDRLDSRMIGAWVSKLKGGVGFPQAAQPVKLKTIQPEKIIKALKNDPIYSKATMKFEKINTTDVVFMNPFIRALKYKQIGNLFNLYSKNHIDPFSPSTLIFSNQKESVVGPPVVEYKNGKYYVIEGNTRFVYAYRHGIKCLNALVVSDVETPLPCNEKSVVKVDQVLLSDRKLEGSQRYGDFDYNTFRHIEARLRPNETYMR